jgi:hypothetical protein
MTEAPDRHREQLLDGIGKLGDLVALLKWLEPSLRAEMSNSWHIVQAAVWVADERRRELDRQVRELDRGDDQAKCLDV